MATITVIRGDGAEIGPPIVEPLLSDGALVARGIAEMDAHAQQFTVLTVEMAYTGGIQLGQLISFTNPLSKVPLVGKVTGINYRFTLGLFEQTLTVEVPTWLLHLPT
jgi:hypothetical protein